MTTIKIPYGKNFLEAYVAEERLEAVLESRAHHYRPEATEADLVRQALENPIGSKRLRDLAKGCRKVVIIASDHTRPVPTKIMAPQMLAEIRNGSPDADITFLVATGFHRASTQEELLHKFGEEIMKNEKIVVHNCWEQEALVDVGKLPSGGALVINKLAMEADLLVSEGFIEPHLFAGFSGGRKSILPGIVSGVTVMSNHCAKFIAHEKARVGILDGNPIHTDMLYAAQQAKLAFILNAVIDADKRIIKVFAGDREQAHIAGCKFVSGLAKAEAKPADIVITSNGGYPLDQNIYQLVKGLSSAEATCKPNGVIIICAACNDGHGGDTFFKWFQDAPGGARQIMDKIMKIPSESTIPDQWAAQIIARVLLKHTVILVTDQCDHQIAETIGMKTAYTLEEALKTAGLIVGLQSKVTVIPDGVAVIL